MKIFLDTANLDSIKKYGEMGIVDGITTNPTLLSKEKGNPIQTMKEIVEYINGPVSLEIVASTFEEMMDEGLKLAKYGENVVVKVPMTADGLKVVKALSSKDIKTNVTLIFSANQALLAAKAGATYLSPFIGRIDDINWDGMALIREISEIYKMQGYTTQILAASIRSSRHIVDSARAGADVVTCPLSAITGLLSHPLTDIGLEKFLADHRKAAGNKC